VAALRRQDSDDIAKAWSSGDAFSSVCVVDSDLDDTTYREPVLFYIAMALLPPPCSSLVEEEMLPIEERRRAVDLSRYASLHPSPGIAPL